MIEVIAAVMIIAMGMIGVLSLVIQNVEAQYINKNVLIASGLAQEGLELVRNIRDNNWLTAGFDPITGWKLGAGAGTNSDIVQDGTYAIDYRRFSSLNATVDSITDDGARLYLNDEGLYTHVSAGNIETNFYRLITIVDDSANPAYPDLLDIKCTIRWKDGTQDHDYTAETSLYNWR